jgi:signal transduction histidine kinase
MARARGAPARSEIDLEFDDEAMALDADPELLTRVLENLVGNAVTYAGSAGPITIACRAKPGALTVEVRDHGPVVPAAERERVFDPLTRGSGTVSMAPGHGLGLTFCRRAIEAHGGSIGVRPNPDGRGNCFFFVLPA